MKKNKKHARENETENGVEHVEEPRMRVLVVDDNKIYRDAFRRNLMLQNHEVLEAEDAAEALRVLDEQGADVVITDLQMRTESEGLDLIREAKSVNPLLPIIMISAVGTFEEGALAQKYGASAVISKARIEDEIERLYAAIEEARRESGRWHSQERRLETARRAASTEGADNPAAAAAVADLRGILAAPETHPYLRSEAFNLYSELQERVQKEEARRMVEEASGSLKVPKSSEELEAGLVAAMPEYRSFSDDSRESLRIAEFLYLSQTHAPTGMDFSRNVGFSFCFAVENEAKLRMARRLQKFLGTDNTYVTITEMMENKNMNLSVYFHQYLLLLLREHPMEFTIDNAKQTFRRILEHQGRYKPDGLKALGIMIIAFGRNYLWTKNGKPIKVSNPMGLKGFESEAEVLRFAELLISLQHYRNPYVHPEISDLEKLSIIRTAAFECLNMVGRLQ